MNIRNFLRVLSYKAAYCIAQNRKMTHKQRTYLYDTIENYSVDVVQVIVSLSIAAFMGIPLQTFVLMLALAVTRAIIGGTHMNTPEKCLLVTTVLVFISSVIAYAISPTSRIIIPALSGITLALVLKLPISEKALKKLNQIL